MGTSVQNNLRKYQIHCWIYALEHGWQEGGGWGESVVQPPTLANLAMYMLDEKVFPAGLLSKFGDEFRKELRPTNEQDAFRYLKQYLNRLCQKYRSDGTLGYLTYSEIENNPHLREAYHESTAHELTERDGKVLVKKTPKTHLDLKTGWATDRRFVRVFHLSDWGEKRIGKDGKKEVESDPLLATGNTPLNAYFKAKQEVEDQLTMDPTTDQIKIPQKHRYNWTLSELTVPRIDFIHVGQISIIVRYIDENKTEKIERWQIE